MRVESLGSMGGIILCTTLDTPATGGDTCSRNSWLPGKVNTGIRRIMMILCENSFNLKTIAQGDFGQFRENNQIIVSTVAKIALRDCF